MILANVSSGGGFERRQASKLESPLRLSFLLGVSVALLDQLGEVPSTMPDVSPSLAGAFGLALRESVPLEEGSRILEQHQQVKRIGR